MGKVKIIELQELATIDQVPHTILRKLGIESEQKLNELIKQKLSFDFVNYIRLKMKKDLFDQIDKKYMFDLPDKIIEQDFQNIWNKVIKTQHKTKDKHNEYNEEQLKSEYREIAKRRVKLGLIISEISR